MNAQPDTRYARSGDVHIAYQVLGDGPLDIVFVPGFASHLEWQWEEPMQAAFFRRLASFSRLIRFDKRGAGLSDRVTIGNLEERMDDIRAVMDAAGSRDAALVGLSEGAPLSVAFGATYPERTRALVLWNGFARLMAAPDYPIGRDPVAAEQHVQTFSRDWGTGAYLEKLVPSAKANPAFVEWWTRFERLAMSPGAALAAIRWVSSIDARAILPAVRVPTLLLHARDDTRIPLETSRYMASRIEGARLVELPGSTISPGPPPNSLPARSKSS